MHSALVALKEAAKDASANADAGAAAGGEKKKKDKEKEGKKGTKKYLAHDSGIKIFSFFTGRRPGTKAAVAQEKKQKRTYLSLNCIVGLVQIMVCL